MSLTSTMTKAHTSDLIKFLNGVYPRFEVTQNRIDAWHEIMKDQDYNIVFSKAKEHAKRENFPPVPAELIVIKPKKSRDLAQLEKDRAEQCR